MDYTTTLFQQKSQAIRNIKSENVMFEITSKSLKRSLAIAVVPFMGAAILLADENDEVSDPLDRVELRSVASLPGGMIFSIHESESEQTFWIEVGQTVNGIEAVAFDADTNRLTLRYGESERVLGLSHRRVRNPDEIDPNELSRRERRELRRQEQTEQARQEWQDFRQRFETAASQSPEIREIREHFGELREEWRQLREDMQGVERDSEEFNALRERGRQLRQEQRMLHNYAMDTITQHPSFNEDDADRLNRIFGGRRNDNQRGR
jgi:hypothetical protein